MANLRIGGLASGMDIDQLVGDLMKAERLPLNKLYQKKQLLEWQRDDYRSMNKAFVDFDKFVFDGISRQATFNKKTVTSSKEAEVSVKNINANSNLTSTIKVEQIAEAAYITGSNDIRGNTSFDPSMKLSEQRVNLATDFTSNTFTIQAIDKDGKMAEKAVSFTIDPNVDSLDSIISRINNSEAGVVAFYDNQTGKMSITAKNTGDVKNVDGTDSPEIILTGDFLLGTLNLPDNTITAQSAGGGRNGKNAIFTINGLETTRPSNTFNINGFEFTLKEATNTEIRISSASDEEAIFNSIKEFVNKYNELIDLVGKEVKEERYRKYQPLSDEEKESMSEKQVELWEEKARSGLLRNDSILTSGLNKMRIDLYSEVSNPDINSNYNQLSKIGIKTSVNYMDGGMLTIDENKLREAIQKDPNAIYNLFNSEGTTTESQGLARRLRDTIKDTISKVEARAGNALRTSQQFTIGRNLVSVDKQIDSFNDRLLRIEDRYWRQFTAMEKAIQKSNEQATYLMQQFGGGQ